MSFAALQKSQPSRNGENILSRTTERRFSGHSVGMLRRTWHIACNCLPPQTGAQRMPGADCSWTITDWRS